jgi:putative redox protein
MTQLNASVTLNNAKLGFTGTAGDHPAISIDYIPPLGDGQGYTSLQLLLISLASCSGSSVTSLLRRMRRTVAALQVDAEGDRREQHPTCFEAIRLTFVIKSPDATKEDVDKAMLLSEESICPVWSMLKNSVKISATYTLSE